MPIRLATPDDAQALAEVHVAAWQAAYAGLMPQSVFDALGVAQHLTSWQRMLSLSAPRSITAVATDRQGAVVGFALYGQEQAHAELQSGELFAINLAPEVWRCGLGRQLCEWVFAHAREQQWPSLALWVLRENVRARAFYERLGFVSDGVEKTDASFPGATLNELRYRKCLIGSASA